MVLIEKIRAEFATTSAVREACDRLDELQDEYDRYPCHSPERRAVGSQIADQLKVIADGIEVSKLSRLLASFDPYGLRWDAVGWRNGDDMSGEEACPHGY